MIFLPFKGILAGGNVQELTRFKAIQAILTDEKVRRIPQAVLKQSPVYVTGDFLFGQQQGHD
jgi:hypothetical protein